MPATQPLVPLIVCGFGRSGTRTCANILANCEGVELQGEMVDAETTLAYLARMKIALASGEASRRTVTAKDYALCRDVFRGASHASPVTRRAARYFGHKTPHHERWFDAYERLFDRDGARARYVYCLRRPHEVWRSLRMMPWNGHVDARAFARSWVRSIQRLEAMETAAPERVIRFNLNAMLAAPDRLAWTQTVLLQPLGLSAEEFRRPFDSLGNTNSARAKFGCEPEALPDGDVKILDKALGAVADAYFDGVG